MASKLLRFAPKRWSTYIALAFLSYYLLQLSQPFFPSLGQRSSPPSQFSPSQLRNMSSSVPATLALDSVYHLNSGHDMPLLGFGVFRNDNAEPSCVEAFKAGYRHIDSAQYYHNEAQVGRAVRASGLDRSDVFITTKVMPGTKGYQATARSVDASLKEFGFEYVDLFLIHDPLVGPGGRLDKYRALLDAKKEGKIRSVGVSNYGVHHLEEIRKAGLELPAVNQIELHPFNQQRPIVEYCKEHNIAVQAYCPIVQGQLNHPVIQRLATKYGRDGAQVLLRWHLQKGLVPLPKSATPSRIHSNARLYDFELAPEDVASLDELDRGKAGSTSWDPVDVE